MIYQFNALLGMKIERSLLIVTLLPFALGFGPWVASAVLFATAIAVFSTNTVFSEDEKRRVWDILQRTVDRFRPRQIVPSIGGASLALTMPEIEPYGVKGEQSESTFQFEVPTPGESSHPLRVMFCNTSLHVGGAETLLFNLIQRLDRTR